MQYTYIEVSELTAQDLIEEIAIAQTNNATVVCARITLWNERTSQPYAEAAQALYLPSDGRLGVAWGANATWADVASLEAGIEMWCNDPHGWLAAN